VIRAVIAYLVQRGRVHISLTDLADEVLLVDVADDGGIDRPSLIALD